ncbi:hypothetical protein Pmar_PMAR002558, partial [Perkinsus marinus ATCC 50983]
MATAATTNYFLMRFAEFSMAQHWNTTAILSNPDFHDTISCIRPGVGRPCTSKSKAIVSQQEEKIESQVQARLESCEK